MPPPPVPAIVSRISTPSPAATQAAAVSAPVVAPVLAPVVPAAAPSTAVSAPLEVPAEPAAVAASSAGSVPAADIAASLRDSAGLYALPKEELEKLVAEVIREEGFADLVRAFPCQFIPCGVLIVRGGMKMKALDGMWRVKGLVGAV